MRSEFVLYWMHHAVRGHENPALDVAILEGNRLGLPVLVYQGLSGHHRYNSDRHHTFILEGARDAHRELTTLGVRALFQLDKAEGRRSRLRELAARAALLVVEDYPAPPFKRCTKRLSDALACPVIAVDCACIVPMRLQPKGLDRAFEFHQHNKAEFDARVRLPWHPVRADRPAFDGNIGFEVLDLGIDVTPEKFVESIREFQPQVVGLSGFLTLAFDAMKDTVEAIEAAGLRDSVKIVVGGGQITDKIREYAGADAYGDDAMEAVNLAAEWIGG